MNQLGEVTLQEEIESDQVWKTVDLYSEEMSLGSNDLQFITEGKITIGLPVIKNIIRKQREPGPSCWDYYSISLLFTLHRLEGNRHYESAVFKVTLDNPMITAANLFPTYVTMEIKVEKKLSILPELNISFEQASMGIEVGKFGASKNYITLTPLITSFGQGQGQFYWEYKEFREQPVLPGDKQVIAVLRVPHGATRINAQLEYKATIVNKIFDLLDKKSVKSGILPVTWILPESC